MNLNLTSKDIAKTELRTGLYVYRGNDYSNIKEAVEGGAGFYELPEPSFDTPDCVLDIVGAAITSAEALGDYKVGVAVVRNGYIADFDKVFDACHEAHADGMTFDLDFKVEEVTAYVLTCE